jgi:DsbC/DsbD-like thiol-disulfide interchange protein
MEDRSVTLNPARLISVLLLGLAVGVAPTAAEGGAKKSEDTIKATAKADKPDADGNQLITLTLEIEKPWHIYANPVGQDDLASAQTRVTVNAKNKPEEVKIEYPPGKVLKDSTVGDYKIYEDKVEIKVRVKRAKGDTDPLELAVRVTACNDKTCLQPSTIKVKVP